MDFGKISGNTPLRELSPCVCGGSPTLTRECGWWHIECRECHRYPYVKFGCTRVWGWNTRREAMQAWLDAVTSMDPDKMEFPEKVRFQYQLLARLRSDCMYYLGGGNRQEKYLWAGNVEEQIKKMRELYDALPDKPMWLTWQDIDRFEQEMTKRGTLDDKGNKGV